MGRKSPYEFYHTGRITNSLLQLTTAENCERESLGGYKTTRKEVFARELDIMCTPVDWGYKPPACSVAEGATDLVGSTPHLPTFAFLFF
jgi:hypothetical protein